MISEALIDTLKNCKHLVVFTGAGVSAESGIPTFRDALTGLWTNYDPTRLASESGFLADPALVWGWYEWRRKNVLRSQPNAAHVTIAQLESCVPKVTLITQNVDDLHERAGSKDVIHLHGSIHKPRCFICNEAYEIPSLELSSDTAPVQQRLDPPCCPGCSGNIRPGVVWFGEALPEIAWEQAISASQTCDLFLLIGTSGLVWPAANLPYVAKQKRTPVAQINPVSTDFNMSATYNLLGKAGDVLPELYTAAFGL